MFCGWFFDSVNRKSRCACPSPGDGVFSLGCPQAPDWLRSNRRFPCVVGLGASSLFWRFPGVVGLGSSPRKHENDEK